MALISTPALLKNLKKDNIETIHLESPLFSLPQHRRGIPEELDIMVAVAAQIFLIVSSTASIPFFRFSIEFAYEMRR